MGATRLLVVVICGAGLLLAGLAISLTGPEAARAEAGIIYVDRDAPGPFHDGLSWTTAYTLLQSALDVAVYGDEIWVAEGVYVPTAGITRTATFSLPNGVALYGGFGGFGISETVRTQRDWNSHATVLSGDLDGNDLTDPNGVVTDTANISGTNALHVVVTGFVTETTVLDGFTITAGYAEYELGGGLYTIGSPTLANLVIRGNYGYHGGGMLSWGNPTLTNVTFQDNRCDRLGGGMSNTEAPQLTDVLFFRNYAEHGGGGLHNLYGEPSLVRVDFIENQAGDGVGGGVYTSISGVWSMTNVRFIRNSAALYGGGLSVYDSMPLGSELVNVVFNGNSAPLGGGIYVDEYSRPHLINATLTNNTATGQGGGVYVTGTGSNPAVTNSILWGNSDEGGTDQSAQIHRDGFGNISVSYSLVQGGVYPGTGNISVNPLFVDLDGSDNITGTIDDDLHPSPASPAIDAGDNMAVPVSVTTDLDGSPRFVDVPSRIDTGNGTPPIVDMGAYEAEQGVIYVDRDAPGPAYDGLSWTTAYTRLQTALDVAVYGDEIWVAEGVYTPTNVSGVNATFYLVSGVGLYGGFGGYGISETLRTQRDWEAYPTVLSGDLEGNDRTDANGIITSTSNITGTNVRYVVRGNGITETAVIDGFVVTGGGCIGYSGMRNDDASPTMTNLTFIGNCGGLRNISSNPKLVNVSFLGSAWGSGINNNNSDPVLINVVFSGNHSRDGGGIYNYDSSPTLTNATFSGNVADRNGGAVYNTGDSHPILTNCILWGNSAPVGGQIDTGCFAFEPSCDPSMSYSIVQAGYLGVGNIDADPQFVDADGPDGVVGTLDDDLRLQFDSPALDSGNNDAVPADVADLDGDGNTAEQTPLDAEGGPRFFDAPAPNAGSGTPPIVDIGAYELSFSDLWIAKEMIPDTPVWPGYPITYVITFGNDGLVPVAGVVITDLVPIYVSVISVMSSGVPISDTGTSPPFVWEVGNLPVGAGGVITVSGSISPSLVGPFWFTNTAMIDTTSVDTDTRDNEYTVATYIAGVVYVDRDATAGANDGSSWMDAYTSLQSALEAATPGTEIWVAEGVYTPTNVVGQDATFRLVNDVALYGGFVATETLRTQRNWDTNVTILSGDLEGDDFAPTGVVTDTDSITGTNAYHVVLGTNIDRTAVLDGFTVTGGRAGSNQLGWPGDCYGGGVFVDCGSPTLTNLTFIGNAALEVESSPSTSSVYGGGLWASYSSPTLQNVIFSHNSANAGGGMFNFRSSPVLTGVVFSYNEVKGDGAGIYNHRSNLVLTDVVFQSNAAGDYGWGGGICNEYEDHATLTNVLFSGNSAESGGGVFCAAGSLELTNVAFSGNTVSSRGGGIRCALNDLTLLNVTFGGNHSSNQGGGIFNGTSNNLALTNTILWGNSDSGGVDQSAQIHRYDASPITVSYSLVQGGVYTGVGNISADPLFVDFDGADNITGTLDDDLRLILSSPAIDAGDNAAVPPWITTDLAGNPRFQDIPGVPDTGSGAPPIVDMGVYEAEPVPDLEINKTVTPALVGSGGLITYVISFGNIGPFPITDTITITDHIPVEVVVGGVISSGVVITEVQGGPNYVWEVAPLAVGEGGAITISGQISLAVSGLFSLTNRAMITTAVDRVVYNNMSAVSNTVDAEPPYVVSASPVSATTGVSLDAAVVVTFSEEIDAPTFAYTVTPDPGGWAEVWGSGGRVVTLTHTAFSAETVYTVTVTGADDLVGNPLADAPYQWLFETADAIPPQIVAVSPISGAVDVGLGAPVVVTFSEEIDTGTFTYTVVPDPGGWTEVWDGAGEVVTLTHTAFGSGTTYTVTVSAADDLVGNPLQDAPHAWSFTTADVIPPQIVGVYPPSGSVGVVLGAPVVITFSEEISAGTLAYIVQHDPGGWGEAWGSEGSVVILTHTAFAEQTTYTVTVTGADDLAGNPLADAPYLWAFTTADVTAPEILAVSPISGAVGVGLGEPVVITFSEQIATGTVTYTVVPDPGGWGETWGGSWDVLTLNHNPFDSETTYTFTVIASEDLAGNPLSGVPYEWSFETADVTWPSLAWATPLSGTVDVALHEPVVLAFSEPMATSSLSYTLEPDPGGWAESWGQGDTVVTLTHALFENHTVYTVTLVAANDVAGNPLVHGAISWSFATEGYLIYLPLTVRDSGPSGLSTDKAGKQTSVLIAGVSRGAVVP